MKTIPVVVGFQVSRSPEFDLLADCLRIQPPSNYKDKDKIAAYVHGEIMKLASGDEVVPYLFRLERVKLTVLIAPRGGEDKEEDGTASLSTNEKSSAADKLRRWLLKRCSAGDARTPQVQLMFIGFEAALFKKIFGLECAMLLGKPLPALWWYGTSNSRDIEKAVLPTECGKLNIEVVAKAAQFDLEGWTRPMQNAEQDHKIAYELALRLGLLRPGALDIGTVAMHGVPSEAEE